MSGVTFAVAVFAGSSHTCALTAGGKAHCWGLNASGQLGDGTTVNRLSQVPMGGNLSNVITLAAGGGHTCAVIADGTAACWGDNAGGQLGNTTTSDTLFPNAVSGISGSVGAKAIAAGDIHTCAVRSNGTASCWGGGRLGNGTFAGSATPVAVIESSNSSAPLTNAIAIAGGGQHSCALHADGTVRCWGNNIVGPLGDGTTTARSAPVAVSNLTNAIAVTAGGLHSCALVADGTVRCWGYNGFGQLGDGTTIDRLTPISVTGLTNAVALAGEGNHTCALLSDGTVRCWGSNSSGQLGDGTTADRSVPVTVTGLVGVVAITSSKFAHTCALLVDGTGRCWGLNIDGQLGDNSKIQRPNPVTVFNLANAVAMSAGDSHTCALNEDGAGRCWGRHTFGQLGAPRVTTDQLTPVTVFGLTNAASIASGLEHTCAAKPDGAILCWGLNFSGQLGDGPIEGGPTPVAVPSFTLNISPRVTLLNNGRAALVNIIATCEVGDPLSVRVVLHQESLDTDQHGNRPDKDLVGHGSRHFECTGALTLFPVTVRLGGREPFHVGAAQVEAFAISNGHQEWTRAVQIVP